MKTPDKKVTVYEHNTQTHHLRIGDRLYMTTCKGDYAVVWCRTFFKGQKPKDYFMGFWQLKEQSKPQSE